MNSNVCNILKFGKIFRKDILCIKMLNMNIENLITLSIQDFICQILNILNIPDLVC